MIRAIHGAPAEALRQALEALAGLSFWISWTSDPDLGPEPFVSARCMRDAANALRKAARLLDDAADRPDPPPETVRRAAAPVSDAAPEDTSGGDAGPPAADTQDPWEHRPEAEPSPARAGECRPERAAFAPPIRSSMEIRMNHIAPPPEPLIREVPLSCLALAPENVRKTPANQFAEAELVASIKAHGLLENLVARADDPDSDGTERFAVVAGGRRLAALKALAEDGTLDADHPVPCKIAANGNAGELSLAENVIRIAMHPADQVVAFSQLARSGITVAAIAARFGVAERLVEQRLRLGNAAPELLDAYRADDIDLETLKAFSVTTDHDRQRTIWERVAGQGYRPSAWQVKRMLTEERVPAGSPMARFVGVDAYEAAGGPVLRDLFADEHENGVWLEDPALLIELAMKRLQAAADELSTRWKWAEPMADVDWSATARFGRIHPEPAEPTDAEKAEIEKLRTRHDELANMDEDAWTEALVEEAEGIEPRLDEIEAQVEARARFKPEDFAIAGCIATIGRDGTLQVIQGLVRPEDMPKPAEAADAGTGTQSADSGDTDRRIPPHRRTGHVHADAAAEGPRGRGAQGSRRRHRPRRRSAVDPHRAGEGASRQRLRGRVRPHGVPARACRVRAGLHRLLARARHRLQRDRRPPHDADERRRVRGLEPGRGDAWRLVPPPVRVDGGRRRRGLFRGAPGTAPGADKEKLFAAAVARTVKGQLAFEHGARPELEATVARLDIDFAKHVRPTADMLWSRIRKDRILDVARQTLGTAWASARSKYKKADLATAMEEAFAAGAPPVGIGATAHAAALAWAMPGFAAFDTGGTDDDTAAEAAPADRPADTPDASGDANPAPADKPRKTSVVESIESPAVADQRAAALAAAASDGAGEAAPAVEADGGEAPEGPADGNGHDVSTGAEGEGGPEPVNGGGEGEDGPADPSVADAIDAMNAVPTADGGPRVIVQTVGPVNGREAGDDPLEIPEFLRRVH